MKVDMYFYETLEGRSIENSIILVSKELGWIEFFDDGLSPMLHKNKKELIKLYRTPEQFYKYSKLTYLGEL